MLGRGLRFLAGVRDVVWPVGTWLMRVRYGLPCGMAPPRVEDGGAWVGMATRLVVLVGREVVVSGTKWAVGECEVQNRGPIMLLAVAIVEPRRRRARRLIRVWGRTCGKGSSARLRAHLR